MAAGGSKHGRVEEFLREEIDAGRFKPGEPMPAERDLAATLRVNRLTVRRALDRLATDGLLRRIPRKGTFVASPKIARDLVELKGFSSTMKDRGLAPSSMVLGAEMLESSWRIARRLELERPEPVFHVTRLRLADRTPVAVEEAFVPARLVPGLERLDLAVFSLYDAYALQGIALHHARETLAMVRADRATAKLLGIAPSSAVFLFECVTFDADGRAVEFSRSYTRGDLCRFRAELRPDRAAGPGRPARRAPGRGTPGRRSHE